ncbi:cytoplasmic tRNA 2-thiolation protein 2 [Phlebotomus papatasi]|uniref:cytoplasmic tRNA 2-thiolation protein 2 n=1 Tax=Phlebotomus papatasi TaxID=29031 RepID=UPI0024834C5A|nr:cytoplasmic tRNA 2-thiolation protein 2 [Phlebotomus papatasi]
MCSIGEDDFGDEGGAHAMPVNEKIIFEDTDGTCRKCGASAAVKLNFKEAQCRDCFINHVRHKFRANLGSTKILPRDCSVLTVFNGSAGSVCLLDLVIGSLELNNHKRLHFTHHVLFLDDFLPQAQNLETTVEKIRTIVDQFQVKIHFISLAGSSSDPESITTNRDAFIAQFKLNKEMLSKFREEFSNQSTWEDFLVQRKKNLIRKAAKYLNCNHVFLPDITTDLAADVLSNVILGRGASVAFDVGFVDDRIPDIKLLRPMRDLTHQEVDNYVRIKDLEYLKAPCRKSMESIQSLTWKFVGDLQANFSSTVSTIFRTGNKFAPKASSDGICNFCKCNLDWRSSKTLAAVDFSRSISNEFIPDNTRPFSPSSHLPTVPDAEKYCYACQKFLLESSESLIE